MDVPCTHVIPECAARKHHISQDTQQEKEANSPPPLTKCYAVLQHGCANGKQALQTGKTEAEILQEQRKIGTKYSTARHPGHSHIRGEVATSRVWAAKAVISWKEITSRADITAELIQVLQS